MQDKRSLKLYNVIFPYWMLILFPQVWLVVFPGNFLIDSLVLLLCMHIFKQQDKKAFYKNHIFKIFAFGMLADLLGAAYLLQMTLGFELGGMGDELYLTLPAILISAIFIFVFNYFFTFKKCDKKSRTLYSLSFAVITAPYTFLIPTTWLY